MTWSRRQFLTGVGVLAAVSGTAGRVGSEQGAGRRLAPDDYS